MDESTLKNREIPPGFKLYKKGRKTTPPPPPGFKYQYTTKAKQTDVEQQQQQPAEEKQKVLSGKEKISIGDKLMDELQLAKHIPKEMVGLISRPLINLAAFTHELEGAGAKALGMKKIGAFHDETAKQYKDYANSLRTPLSDPVDDVGNAGYMGAVGAVLSGGNPIVGALTSMAGDGLLVNRIIEQVNPVIDSSNISSEAKAGIKLAIPLLVGGVSGATFEKWLGGKLASPKVASQLNDLADVAGATKQKEFPEKVAKIIKEEISEPELENTKTRMATVETGKTKSLTGEADSVTTKLTDKPDIEAKQPTPDKIHFNQPQAKRIRKVKYAGSVNLQRQNIPNAAKRLEYDMFEEYGHKKYVSHEDMLKGADEEIKKIVSDPEYVEKQIKTIKEGGAIPIEAELAHRMLNAEAFNQYVDTAKKVATGQASNEELVQLQETMTARYFDITQPAANQAGRRLNMYNINVGRLRAVDAIAKLENGLNERQMKDLLKVNPEDPESLAKFVNQLPDPKLQDYFWEYMYNSFLSGVPTHIVNTASNTMWLAFQIPHRAMTGAVDKGLTAVMKPLTGKQQEVFMKETLPLLAGFVKPERHKKAFTNLKGFVKGETLKTADTKWTDEMTGFGSAFARSPNKAVRQVGKYLTIPSRMLGGMDVYFKTLAYDMEIDAQATRAALKQGGNVSEFIQNYRQNPPQEAIDAARKFGKYAVFNDDPGKITKIFEYARREVPASRLVVPFVRTVGNLTKRGIEMTPGIGLMLHKGQKPAEVIAKQLEGSILTMALMSKIADGTIIGKAPKQKNERDAFYREGKTAYSVKIGDKYYQWRKVEPFNTVLNNVLSAYDNIVNAEDEDSASEIMMNIANDLVDNVIDGSYMSGLNSILDKNKRKGWIQREITGILVPHSSFWRSIARAYESAVEGEVQYRKSDDWLGILSNSFPGMYAFKEGEVDIWGNVVTFEGGPLRQFSPYKASTAKEDPVERAFDILGKYPIHPSQKIKVGENKVELDADIYRKFIINAGKESKAVLNERVKLPHWKRYLNDDTKHHLLTREIESIMRKIRNKHKKEAIAEYRKRHIFSTTQVKLDKLIRDNIEQKKF